jgi:arginyl-tRNA--protein-N-Asp/Glu arginylyltransferase
MRHTLPIAPQFYVTAPQSCPYLSGRRERKLFTALQGEQAEKLNNALSKQGFRRSQNVLYRPSCTECAACLSARIRVDDFAPRRSQKRVMKRNDSLVRSARSAWATEEQYALFRRYLDARHADGGMADMDVFEFAAMIEETPVKTRVVEYRDQAREDALTAVCLTDILDDGLSLVYSFFDPQFARNSLRHLCHHGPRGARAGGGAALRLPRLLGAGFGQDGLQGAVQGARGVFRR